MTAGRALTATDTSTSPNAIVVNRSFAAKHLGSHPIGASVPNLGMCRGDRDRWEVVGVVDDMRQGATSNLDEPELFLPARQAGCPSALNQAVVVVRAAGDPLPYAGALRRAVREQDPAFAVDSVMTMEDRVMKAPAKPRLYVVVLAVFSCFALAIAAVGLFGVLSYTVAQRSREIGVRTALGARPSDIVALVLRQTAIAAAGGIALGVWVAFAVSRSLASVLYGVNPHDAFTFAAIAVALAVIAAIACAVPARRAARIDPLHVMRGAAVVAVLAAPTSVSTLVGTGSPGYSDLQVNNPYGMAIGPDGALYFCDLDNQRIRRIDPETKKLTTIAGSGERGYRGDGGPAVDAALNMPHEIQFDARGNIYVAERDNHVVRKIDRATGIISTVAGMGVAGFSGDSGPGSKAQLRQPHSVAIDRDGSLLICDIGNRRIRRLDLTTGIITTYAGTGEAKPTPDGAPVEGTALNGPRTIAFAPNGDLFLALREGNAIYRIDRATRTLHHIAGTGEQGYSGDGGPALGAKLGGPKGLAYSSSDGSLYVADTENHVIRRIDLRTGTITTVLGTGRRGDGPESDPLACQLSRPHGVLYSGGTLYVSDSEAHRIRTLVVSRR